MFCGVKMCPKEDLGVDQRRRAKEGRQNMDERGNIPKMRVEHVSSMAWFSVTDEQFIKVH
jgi:hypothetical protein